MRGSVLSSCLGSEQLEARVLLSTVPAVVVTASGRAAPGVGGGAVIAPVPSFLPILPSINNAGDVNFRAQLAGPGVTEANDWAEFFVRSGSSPVAFREGQPAPGYAGGEVLHEDFLYLQGNDQRRVALGAFATTTPAVRGRGTLYAGAPESPQIVLRGGDPAPVPAGLPPAVQGDRIEPFRFLDDGGLWVESAIDDGTGLRTAVYYDPPGDRPPQFVSVEGFFSNGLPAGYPPGNVILRVAAAAPGGHVILERAVAGDVEPPPGTRHVVFAGTADALVPIMRVGDQVPGMAPGTKYGRVTAASVNSSGQVVFFTTVHTENPSTYRYALMMVDGGEVRAVAVSDAPGPKPLPGQVGPVGLFPLIDDSGRITFLGSTAAADPSQSRPAIISGRPGDWHVIARWGDPLPGTSGNVFMQRTFEPTVNASGQVVFVAELSGPGVTPGVDDSAIVATDALGNLQLVARRGQTVDLGGGDVRTVTWVNLNGRESLSSGLMNSNGNDGLATCFNDAGQVVFSVNYAGGGAVLVSDVNANVPQVVGRHVFYNRSSFDGGDAAATSADDAAIAPDKNALLASQDRLPGFDNVTSYDKGINGVMIDVNNLPVIDALLDASDFEFSPAGHDPIAVDVRFGAGEGGSDRITLIWRDYNPLDASPLPQAVANGWLTVTVKANYHTGLSQPDVFSFGNLVGETGDAPTPTRVTAADLASVKRVLNAAAGVESPQDVNRDGKVNALDLGVIKRNLNQSLPPFAPTVALAPWTQPVPAATPALFYDPVPGPTRRPADDLLA